jgi:hypothetical protein
VWITEVDRDAGVDAQLGVLCHLGALVPGQGLAQVLGQGRDLGGDRIPDSFGPMPGQRRPVLDPLGGAEPFHRR